MIVTHYCLIVLVISTAVSGAARRYYATNSCGHVRGPDHLVVLEYDKSVDYDDKKPWEEQGILPPQDLRNTLWECIIVVRGMSAANSKKYLGIQWRNFHIRDPDVNSVQNSVETCGKAYVTIYEGKDTTAKNRYTLCGKDATRSHFEWLGDYVTFYFYADFRHSTIHTPPTTLSPQNNMSVDNYRYPEVSFRVDVTSYDYDCNETTEGTVLKCNQSKRCLDESLKCDYLFSHNCFSQYYPDDNTDQTRGPPSFCYLKSTTTPTPTTTLPPPPIPFDWTPVIAPLCSVFGVVTLCWCCWRPGYLPWRLARLRNAPCINTPACRLCRGRTRCCTCCKACMGDSTDTWDTASVLGQGGNYKPLKTHRSFQVGRDGTGPTANAKPSFASLGMAAMFIGGHHGSVGTDNYSPRPLYGVSNGVGYINCLGNGQMKNGRVHPSQVQVSSRQMSPALSQSTYSDLSTNWLNLLTGDGGHLREQRY